MSLKEMIQGNHIFVFGSGTMSVRVSHLLGKHFGVETTHLELSKEKATGATSFTLMENLNLSGETVLIGIHNEFFDEASVSQLIEYQGAKVIRFSEFMSLFEDFDVTFDSYMLTSDRLKRDKARESLSGIREVFEDRHSQLILDGFQDYVCNLTPPTLEPDPFPANPFGVVERAQLDVIFADIGAYHGGALDTFKEYPQTYFAFEPDIENYGRLVDRMRRKNISGFALPFAVGAKNQIAGIEGKGSSSSMQTDASFNEKKVPVVRLDDFFLSVDPHVIRMDIEGFEKMALEGGKETILRSKPALQIAIYHDALDLPNLLDFLLSLGVYSKYFLRTHRHAFFDTFLYCY